MEVLGGASGGQTGKVWIEKHPTEGWAPGRVEALIAGGKYLVVDEQGEQFEVPQDKARPVDQACLRGVDDLLALGDFNEGALLHNVRVRYFRDEIYTGIGGPILISVNPFQSLAGLYSEQKQKFYRDRATALNNGDLEVPPHLFSVGAASHTAMLQDGKNQSIIISGESGAGKTEATKRILAYFANLQRTAGAAETGGMSIEDQVLRSNPILEAFGNAKTIRNDNSSRFGKFIDIEFDTHGKLQSARISNYLLEKVRIIKQQPQERGYHAFYQLCAGAGAMGLNSMLHLQGATVHAYTSGCVDIPGVDDISNFQEMVECMDSLGFTTEEKNSVFKIGAAVLHLGDLDFVACESNDDGCKISDPDKAQRIAAMLHIELKDFAKVFQFKTLEDPFTKKIIDMPQDLVGSSNTRHSMAKTLYSRLFDWLVCRINQSTMAKKGGGDKSYKIGILDIYGFEVFHWNSFEQLCINFANEKLQQHFNSHMFTLEQQLYTEEGIAWSHITWQDNREIIDALERKPLGLFCILDSECLMPNATDPTCLNKIYNSFKNSRIVYKPSRFASTDFAVAHYAGEVIYDIISFLEKNTDKLHADIINLFKTSSMPILKSLFMDPRFAPELAVQGTPAARGSTSSTMRRSAAGVDNQRAKQNVTVSMMFRQQLDQLVEDLNKTNPRYIRCIKPNANKQAHDFDSIDVQRQLRCAGMLESIRIRRAGYSIRRPFKEFFNRFRVLCPSITAEGRIDPDYKELSRRLLLDMEAKFKRDKVDIEAKSWQIGRSKVFLKEELQSRLEKSIADALQAYIVRIQKRWRGHKLRKRYRAMRKAAVQVQASLRTLRAVAEYQEARRLNCACITVEASLRTAAMRLRHTRRRAAALGIQRAFRGWSCRQRVGKLKGRQAAERIQKLRETEAQKEALEKARRSSEEQQRALEDMQRQLDRARECAQEEAQRQLEETRARLQEQMQARAQPEPERQQESGQLEQLRQELLNQRKENARLQGQLECSHMAAPLPQTSEAEVEHMRRQLQELRGEKVRLEVELASGKSSEQYEVVVAEAAQLREECSALRRGKLHAELQLEQRSSQLDVAQVHAARAEQAVGELGAVRAAFDDLQVQFQKVQAQKLAFEERAQSSEDARNELHELRLEKMRLEGDLETSRMKEAAVSEKLRNSEKISIELQQQRQRVSASELELEASRKHIDKLREQVAQMAKDGNASRCNSLDQLRSELLSRIEAKPRPSVLGGIGDQGSPTGLPEGIDERKTLLNQRAQFEQIKQQFHDAKSQQVAPLEVDDRIDTAAQMRELELEEEMRQLRKENVELNVRIESLQDEVRDKEREAQMLLQSMGTLEAEAQDLKFQLEQQVSAAKRQASDIVELHGKLTNCEGEAHSMRRRLLAAEEGFVRAEEDAKAAQFRCKRLEDELGAIERRARDLQAQAGDAVAQKQAMALQLEEQKALAEQCRRAAEQAEGARIEVESSVRWLESETERLKADLLDTNNEKTKIKQVVDELMRAEEDNKSEELKREVEKYRSRAAYFEREYSNSKQLNAEMTKVMSQMTQAVAERSDEKSDVTHQNRVLLKQLEAKSQELRSAKLERDEVQKQLDALQTTGNFYQERYRDAQDELRILRHDHSISTATSSKLKMRVESLQREAEDLKAQCTKLNYEARANIDDPAKIEKYEMHVKELQRKLHMQDQELDRSQAFAAKSQAVNDCLNTLLVLESEQTSLYESVFPVKDEALSSQFDAKKKKAQNVISRLNEIMTEEERPSIAYMDKRYK